MPPVNTRTAAVVDPILSTHARGYRNSEFVAGSLFPRVTVPNRSMRVIKFGKEAFRMLNTRRAPGADKKRVQYGYASDPISLVQDALEGVVPIEHQEEAMSVPGINLGQGAINMVLDAVDLGLEYDSAQLARTAANYDANHKLALTSTARWTNAASTPQSDIDAGKEAIRRSIGRYPNTLVLGPSSFGALKRHATIKDQFKYTGRESITAEMLAAFFDLKRVVVGTGAIWSIDAGAVTLAKMADVASGAILGRTTAGSGAPEALTGAQATALLDSFAGSAKGLVPVSGGGTTNFLRADGSWAAPAGGGTPAMDLKDFWSHVQIGTGTLTNYTPFIGVAISSGTNSTALASGTLLPTFIGGALLRSSATANSGYRVQMSTTGLFFGSFSLKFQGKLVLRSTLATRLVRIGFHDTTTSAAPTDGAYFEINDNVVTPKCEVGGVETAASTYTCTVDTAYTFEVDVNATGTSARFRIYESLNDTPVYDQSIATNIPTSASNATGAGIVATSSGTAAADLVILVALAIGTPVAYQRATGRAA